MKHEVSSATSNRLMRFLMGFLFATALFLIELGVAEIQLSKDDRCVELVRSSRLLIRQEDQCLLEIGRAALMAFTRGPFAASRSETSPAIVWLITALVYGSMGGFLAQLPFKTGIGLFLGIHILALVVLTFMAYISIFTA